MEDILNVKNILKLMKKRKGLIALVTLLSIIITAIFTFFVITPQYQASTQILVNQNQNNEQAITATEIQSNRELINTYNVIMTSPIILDEVLQTVDLNRSTEQLQSQITVSAEADSQVFTLLVEDANPKIAAELANTIASVFEEEVAEIMNIDNVSVLSAAQESESATPVSPQPVVNIMLSLLFGLIVSLVIAYLIESMDQTIKKEEDIERFLGLTILGSIPTIENDKKLE